MGESGSAVFLQQAHRNNWQRYLASLQPDAPGGWELCVLTASDERQAEMYRRQLALRQEAGLLPQRTEFLVVADPQGRRIGSGGATLRVLDMLASPGLSLPDLEKVPEDALTAGRTLVIHSGGDSRRLPHCSAIGKLFARIPRTLPDGRASTLFDEFLISLSGLAVALPPGVFVASGDVLLIFDHLQIDLHRPGVVGVAAAAPQEMGTHHGVYVCDGNHDLVAYLHKPSLAQLQRWHAIASDGTVDIDTGFVWLDTQAAQALAGLAHQDVVAAFWAPAEDGLQPAAGLNLYGDLLMPLAASTTFDEYLADTSDGPDTPAVRAARQVIWRQLQGMTLAVERLQPAVFVHFGTSHEYWQLVVDSPELARTCGWGRHAAACALPSAQEAAEQLVMLNAAVDGPVRVESRPSLIVDSRVAGPLILQGAALIAGLESEQPLALEADVVLHQLPVQGGFVTRILGLYDDPKHAWDAPAATFMNTAWATWLAQSEIDPETIWPGVPPAARTLWNAELYPLAAGREESLALSLSLQDPAHAPPGWQARWERGPRLSLAESLARADGARILTGQAGIEDHVALHRFHAAIVAEEPAAEARHLLGTSPGAVRRRGQQYAAQIEDADPLFRLRGYTALAEATGQATWEERAFATLARMIEASLLQVRPPAAAQGQPAVRVEAAARIDFGGGWTDTPPYSIERGGTVLNAAVALRGRHPIVVEARRLPEPRLLLESRDIGARLEPTLAGEVLAYANPADPFALLKAAVVLRGVVPARTRPDQPLAELLHERGGLQLSTQTAIPRGSGLGTSSIMAGAVLAALARLQGLELSSSQLFDEVLCLEQMLTCGGGWQDQVGGLTGGIKLITTQPGLPQRVQVEPVILSPSTQAELADRLLLVYTGQQRLAKNLLQAVMRRWMAREPEMVWIQNEIARLAVAMRDALQAGDLEAFGALMGQHWTINKRMDPGCTNPFIDDLFAAMGPYIHGGKLAGAGGGGFAIVVTRDREAAGELAAVLRAKYAGTLVEIWPCEVPDLGTVSTVGGSA